MVLRLKIKKQHKKWLKRYARNVACVQTSHDWGESALHYVDDYKMVERRSCRKCKMVDYTTSRCD